MRTRIAFAVIVLLSLLSMAPDVPDLPLEMYLPLAYKTAPEPTLWALSSMNYFPHNEFHNIAQIDYNRIAHATYAMPFDAETGRELSQNGFVIIAEGDHHDTTRMGLLFPVPCSAIDTDYSIRIDLIFEDGFKTSLYGTFVPVFNLCCSCLP
jgi:hypothetical protein